jgi:folate-binding protein YgfZ
MLGKASIDLLGYESALNRTAYYLTPGSGYLRLSGPDRIDFLQRQTTNDLNSLSPGHTLVTTLTSPTARILDVLTLVADEDTIGVLTLPRQAAQTASYLQSRIFFMDDVAVSDASTEFVQIELLGPQAGVAMTDLGFSNLPEEDKITFSEINEVAVQAFNTFGPGLRLLVPVGGTEALLANLEGIGVHRLETDTYEVLRIEAGVPAAGHELTEDYTPLETNLAETVSMTKGCFTGQEVIARQVNFDKVTKQLAGLRLEETVNAGRPVHSPEKDQSAGVITSTTTSPRFGPIALAVLKRPFDQPGTQLIAKRNANSINATVSTLPFLSDLQG